MAVLRESPWYNQILEEGLQQARRQDIVRLLQTRFDPASPRLATVAEQLAAIENVERLQDLLMEAACTSSLEAFLEHLT
jgi:hypothetical protein